MHPTIPCSLLLAAFWGLSANAQTAQPPLPLSPPAYAVADLSNSACYGIASGGISLPSSGEPDALDRSVKAIEQMGLSYGVTPAMLSSLGGPGVTLVSQATMGSKSVVGGDVVLAVGGRQPGCRVILVSEGEADEAKAVSGHLIQLGWKPAPTTIPLQNGAERRMFVKRDNEGAPYLMNLVTFTTPVPGSKLRLFTTTTRIPSNVQLPPGL